MVTRTLLERVLDSADTDGDRMCVRLMSRRKAEGTRTLGEIVERAGHAAAYLRSRGIGPGDVVALIGTHHLDVYSVWLGALWVGAVPTVLPEPTVRVDRQIYLTRLATQLRFAEARLVAHDPEVALPDLDASVGREAFDSMAGSPGPEPPVHAARPDDLAVLQHSSGTTGLPKGIMLSHRMILGCAEQIVARRGYGPADVGVSWLPLYHDMGLIGAFIIPLVAKFPLVWLSPFEWVARPALLLEAITRYGGTVTWVPNFAFTFLAQRVADPRPYDLSSLRAIYCGSEPISAASVDSFVAHFAPAGLRRDAVHAAYGMAECVLSIACTGPSVPPKYARVAEEIWRCEHRAVPAPEGRSDTALVHVSSGPPLDACRVRIADDSGGPLPNATAGRVLVRTPYLFSGYHRRDDLNPPPLDVDGFYDTGDLGYLDDDGHLFVTGRAKDLIIVGGRNVYPQEIEEVADRLQGVHAGRAVCFGVPMKSRGTEGIVLLFESDEAPENTAEVTARIRRAVVGELDVDLADTRSVPRGSLRKSTSGKLARAGNREWYLEGRFGAVPDFILE